MADYPVTPHTPALSEQEIIRRQKLQSLIDAGQNPYAVTHFDVTHHPRRLPTTSSRSKARRSLWRAAWSPAA